ncbi:ICP34.5 [Macropodid alphaherpesvirus 2]|uniref:ICP34.5 n=1 Tax=Macropodid alphaherpesvirus 2 TaxID=83440 RepID=A0AAE7MLT9_9ALPH|nr:ICP34.5 [Macropodid alphaherpesvirus 2]YP_010798863.1 ICP34.5 [Macropodid alphaherpesvirus 2]QOD40248.1 ICP34.5 [Macropodid alphaherpesvirus 2]QOD40249.1 ICP34.5 [Macropodid alphaherpesvirus 2]WGO49706.1 ICP34.5 [Macropodid alphaherpesvirus 2]WGO49762.1 ICP34.5 [Macropodid alphaherpesvirus 2]
MTTRSKPPSPSRFFIWFDPLQPHRPTAVFYNNLDTLFRAQVPAALTHRLQQRAIHRSTSRRCEKGRSRLPSASPERSPNPPRPTVRFSANVQVRPLVVWSTASRLARQGSWKRHACDRIRFKDRIKRLGLQLDPALQPHVRACVLECLNDPTLLTTRLSYCLSAGGDYLAQSNGLNNLPYG